MKAVNIILKGDPHKQGLRHCVIAKAKESGISGYLNYRQQGKELFIHAEGSNEAIDQYLFWLHSLSAELQIKMEYNPASILECQDFRICCDTSMLTEVTPVTPVTYSYTLIAETNKIEEEIRVPGIRVSKWVPPSINIGVKRMIKRINLAGLF